MDNVPITDACSSTAEGSGEMSCSTSLTKASDAWAGKGGSDLRCVGSRRGDIPLFTSRSRLDMVADRVYEKCHHYGRPTHRRSPYLSFAETFAGWTTVGWPWAIDDGQS